MRGWSGQVLSEVSLQVRKGEVVLIRGPNGSGKTTLLRIIARVLKPDLGRVLLSGRDLHRDLDVRAKISYCLERLGLLRDYTILDNTKFFVGVYGSSYNEERFWRYVKMFQLEDYLKDRISELSTGTKKKVALIRSLSFSAELYLLGLDSEETLLLLSPEIIFSLIVTGKLVRISYSMKDTGLLEVVLSQRKRLSQIMLALLIGSSLKYSLPTMLGGAMALIPSFLTGKITVEELFTAFGTMFAVTIIILAVCLLTPLIMRPGEAQYWSEATSFGIISYIYFGPLSSPNPPEDLAHLFMSGYFSPTSLILGILVSLLANVLLAELSEEKGSVESRGEENEGTL